MWWYTLGMNDHTVTDAPIAWATPEHPCCDCGATGVHSHLDRTHRDARAIIRDSLSAAEFQARQIEELLIESGKHPECIERAELHAIIAECSYARQWLDSTDNYPIPDPQR